MIRMHMQGVLGRRSLATTSIVLIFLFISAALTIFGLTTTVWSPRAFWHAPTTLVSMAWIVLPIVSGWLIAALIVPQYACFALVTLLLGVAGSSAGVWPTMSSVLVFVSGLALGDLLTRRTRTEEISMLPASVDTALGIGIQAALFHASALLPVNTALFYFFALLAPIVLNWSGMQRYALLVNRTLFPTAAPPRHQIAAAVLPVALLLILLLLALFPEIMSDATSVYLPMAEYVSRFGLWHFDVARSNVALFSLQTLWPAIAAYVMGGGEIGAKLVNFGFLLLLSGCFYAFARTFVRHAVACIALSLLLSTPVTFLTTASLFYDNSVAALVLASITALFYRGTAPEPTQYVLAIVILAAAISSKIVAIVLLPGVGLFSLYQLWRSNRLRKIPTILALSLPVAALVSLPPYLLAYAKTGSPFFPLLNPIFKSPQFDLVNVGRDQSILSWSLLYNLTFDSINSDFLAGAAGFHFMVFLPAAIILILVVRPATVGWLAFITVAGTISMFGLTGNLRYHFQLFPPLCLLIAFLLEYLFSFSNPARWALTSLAGLVVAANFWFAPAAASAYRDVDFALLWSNKVKQEYFSAHRGQRFVADIINLRAGDNSRVLFNVSGSIGIQGEMLFNSWYNHVITEDLQSANSGESLTWALNKHRITHLVLSVHDATSTLSRFARANANLLLNRGGVELWELKKNPVSEFRIGTSPRTAKNFEVWNRIGNPRFLTDPHRAVLVDASNYIHFDFDAGPGLPYRVELGFSCLEPRQGLVTVNVDWSNDRDDKLASQASQFRCGNDGQLMQATTSFTAPAASVMGRLSVSGIGSATIEIRFVRIIE